MTLTLARDLAPARVVGVDIDQRLISIARKNVKHYNDAKLQVCYIKPVTLVMLVTLVLCSLVCGVEW